MPGGHRPTHKKPSKSGAKVLIHCHSGLIHPQWGLLRQPRRLLHRRLALIRPPSEGYPPHPGLIHPQFILIHRPCRPYNPAFWENGCSGPLVHDALRRAAAATPLIQWPAIERFLGLMATDPSASH